MLAICMLSMFINNSSEPWNDRDMRTYDRAEVVCSTDDRYKKTHPCVSKFIKKEPLVYNVLCGEER